MTDSLHPLFTTGLVLAFVMLVACDGAPDSDRLGADDGGVVIDWVDALMLNGTSYHVLVEREVGVVSIPETQRGDRYAEVEQQLAGNVFDRFYQPMDGDAAALKEGTPIYEIEGFDPRFRVGAEVDGSLRVYEAHTNASATTAGEILDLSGKVTRISLSAVNRPQIERERIEDPGAIDALVDSLLGASIGDTGPVDAMAEETVLLTFHLFDGTTFQRLLDRDSGILTYGITLPGDFMVILEDTLEPAP